MKQEDHKKPAFCRNDTDLFLLLKMADEIESNGIPDKRVTRSAVKGTSKKPTTKEQRRPATRSTKKATNQQNNQKNGSKKSIKTKSKRPVSRRLIQDDNNNNIADSDDSDEPDDDNDSDYDVDEEEDDEEEINSDDHESDEYSGEEMITPLALTDNVGVAGEDVFGFQTPRGISGRSLAQAASKAIHTKKSLSSNKYTKKTPGRKIEQERLEQNKEESQQKKPRKAIKTSDKSQAPHATRRQVVLQSPVDSDDGSNSEHSCESDASGFENEDDSATKNYKQVIADLPEDSRSMVEEYFAVHHDSKCLTSDRTLASLATPLMDHEEVSKHLKQVSATHPKESLQFYTDYRKYFAKWMFQIRHGFNLMLYGLGSKRVLIDQFRSSMLQGYTHLVVNGYFPSITIKNILNMITEDVLGYNGSFKSIIDQTTFIQETYKKGKASGELYLIIHNIEGTMLRSKKAQTVLSLLAEIPFVHVIASIDHINAPLVWDQCMCSRFKFLWYDVTTFEPYTEETSYENSLMVQQSGSLALSSMNHVMRSLTINGQSIFLLIVNNQLQEKDNSSYIGYSITDLYYKCREKFFVNSEQTLRAQLTEFRDHKLIRSKKGADGVEHLIIPLDASTLQQFLEEQQSTK